MKKADIIERIANTTGVSRKDAGIAIDVFLESVKDALVDGDSISFAGFGTFSIMERQPRKGRNPQTGELIMIPATKIVKFKVSNKLKDKVKGR